MKILKNKKAEMPWWLVMLILALLFLLVIVMISTGVIDKALNTIGGIQDQTDDEADKITDDLFGENSGNLNPTESFLPSLIPLT